MKAIETIYNGTNYRSKTEAKWALFMDLIGCKFIYEPQAYDLGESGCYLPDFWLPALDAFVEIKPDIVIDSRTSPTAALCAFTRKNVFTFCGSPEDPSQHWTESGYLCTFAGPEDQTAGDTHHWFCVCPVCKTAGIEFMGRTDRIGCACPKSDHGDKGYNFNDPVLLNAYAKVKNAFRWEAGK